MPRVDRDVQEAREVQEVRVVQEVQEVRVVQEARVAMARAGQEGQEVWAQGDQETQMDLRADRQVDLGQVDHRVAHQVDPQVDQGQVE